MALYIDTGYVKDGYVQTDVTVDWKNRIIFVPKFFMILTQTTPTVIYQLDIDFFRLKLKELEASGGIPYPDTHAHNTTVNVGGAILARVVEIINDYTITFEDGKYAVNLVGANSNVGDVINVNQVSIRSNNSAGLQDLNSLQAASYNGGVAVDVNSSNVGTIFPIGTRQNPVNNMQDAVVIAKERGLRTFFVICDLTLTSIDASDGYIFAGDNPITTTITILDGANVNNCEFTNLTVTGVIDNNNLVRQCALLDISHMNGFAFQCSLFGTITLGGGSQANMLSCYSGVAGGGNDQMPHIDMGGSGKSLVVRDFHGGLGLANSSGTSASSIDMSSGRVHLDGTVTGGNITIRGIADVTDGSNGGMVTDLTSSNKNVSKTLLDTHLGNHNISGSLSDEVKNARINAGNAFAVSV